MRCFFKSHAREMEVNEGVAASRFGCGVQGCGRHKPKVRQGDSLKKGPVTSPDHLSCVQNSFSGAGGQVFESVPLPNS